MGVPAQVIISDHPHGIAAFADDLEAFVAESSGELHSIFARYLLFLTEGWRPDPFGGAPDEPAWRDEDLHLVFPDPEAVLRLAQRGAVRVRLDDGNFAVVAARDAVCTVEVDGEVGEREIVAIAARNSLAYGAEPKFPFGWDVPFRSFDEVDHHFGRPAGSTAAWILRLSKS